MHVIQPKETNRQRNPPTTASQPRKEVSRGGSPSPPATAPWPSGAGPGLGCTWSGWSGRWRVVLAAFSRSRPSLLDMAESEVEDMVIGRWILLRAGSSWQRGGSTSHTCDILCVGRSASSRIALLAHTYYWWWCIGVRLRRLDLLYVEHCVHNSCIKDHASELRRACIYRVTSRSGCDHNSDCQHVEAGRLGVGKSNPRTRPFTFLCVIQRARRRAPNGVIKVGTCGSASLRPGLCLTRLSRIRGEQL